MDRQGDADDARPEPPAGSAEPPARTPERPWHELSVEEQLDHYRRTAQEPPPHIESVAQYYEHYDYPPTGLPFKGYRGQPRWGILIAVLVVVVLGGCSFLVYMAYRGAQSIGMISPQLPPAAVHVGTQLPWRELDRWPAGGTANIAYSMRYGMGLRYADFDADGDDEILCWRESPSPGPTSHCADTLYELDGSQRQLNLQGHMYMEPLGPWDYDGDGTPEIACGGSSGNAPVFDLNGQVVARLAGEGLMGDVPTADVDGDGKVELLLTDPMSFGTVISFASGGRQVWSVSVAPGAWTVASGDIDGDGLAEVLDTSGGNLEAKGMGKPPQTIGGWPSYCSASCCIDLNGDGRDEIIALDQGYLDPAAGSFVSFQQPGWQGTPTIGLLGEGFAAAGDIDGDGAKEIITCSSVARSTPTGATAMLSYDLSGNLTYHEEFGEGVAGVAIATAQGQEYLVVMTATRLLVYP